MTFLPSAANRLSFLPVLLVGFLSMALVSGVAGAGSLEGTLSAPGGAEIEVPLVFLYPSGSVNPILVATPGPGGAYRFPGLATGDYSVAFSGRQGQRAYFEFYDDVATLGEATPVPVIAGQATTGIDGEIGQAPGGTVAGRVLDSYGRHWDFATVTGLSWDDGAWVEVYTADADWRDGTFALDLPAGTWRLKIEAGSWLAPGGGTVVEFFDGAQTVDGAVDIDVAVAQTVDGIEPRVGGFASGSISGLVSDSSGAPVPDVEVRVFDRGRGELFDALTFTAGDGSYTVSGLWPESYFIDIYDPLGRFAPTTFGGGLGLRVPVADGVAVSEIDLTLEPAAPGQPLGSVAGTVTDEGGAPLRGVRVRAYGLPCNTGPGHGLCDVLDTTVTDVAGRYRLRSLASGNVAVGFSAPDGTAVDEFYDDRAGIDTAVPVQVISPFAVEGIDATLATAGAIEGVVTNAFGQPFTLTIATAFVPRGGQWEQAAQSFALHDGRYRLDGLVPGTYRVGLSGGSWTGPRLFEFWDDSPDLQGADDVSVVAGQVVTGIDAELGDPPPGALAGAVTDGSGAPVAGIEVRLYGADLQRLARTAVTAADGTWTVGALFDGIYYAEFVDPAAVLPGEYFDDAPTLWWATPIPVAGGPVTGIDAVLDGAGGGPGGGTIEGTVSGGGGPLGGIQVTCERIGPGPPHPGGPSTPCSGTTAADGSFSLGGYLPAGNYRVRFRDPTGTWAAEWWDDTIFRDAATPVDVVPGAVAGGINGVLETAAAIEGTIRDPDGDAFQVYDAAVFARPDPSSPWTFVAGDAGTGGDGSYRVDGLASGTYRIRFLGFSLANPGGALAEFWDNRGTLETGDDLVLAAGQTATGVDAVLGDLPSSPANPGFDGGVDGWTVLAPATGAVEHDVADARGDEDSGSAVVRNPLPGDTFAVVQCLPVSAGTLYDAGAWTRVTSDIADAPRVDFRVEYFNSLDCAGEPASVERLGGVEGSTAGWVGGLGGRTRAPRDASSALVGAVVDIGPAVGATVHVDELSWVRAPEVFRDDFESGGYSAWSRVVQ
ncbi:MAG: carboxypeptidase-like regulatory domain-containing protein [Acidobacteriota bacterium]